MYHLLTDGPVVQLRSSFEGSVKLIINACTVLVFAILQFLGLRKIRQVVEVEDTPAVRGMINKVRHLIVVLEN